ncbi:MAG: hypothetical protein ACQ9MH_20145 [Nitrospinales bacterium]
MWKVLERINLTGGDNDEQHASLSFRQVITDGDMIEITSVDVLNTEGYDINLPVGSYSVVEWTLGFDTQTSDLTLSESDSDMPPIEKNIDFP